jgi:type 1 fimbriae regulatory protein FimE
LRGPILTKPPEVDEDDALRHIWTTTAGFLKTISRIGEVAKLPFPIHPHMLRHSTGYKLANDGHDTRALQHYMGHRNIMHAVRYTDMAPDRFKNFWKE